MTSRAITNRPRVGDKVWVYDRFMSGKQPNGEVALIDWEEQTLLVRYLDKFSSIDEFYIFQFEYMFDPSFGGTWYIGGKHPMLKDKPSDVEETSESFVLWE